MKLHCIAFAALAATAAALPAHAVLVSAPSALGGGLGTVNFEAYDGLLSTGPLVLASGLVFTGDEGSEVGAFSRDLGDNGAWGAGNNFLATGFVGELRFTFTDGLRSGAGALVNHYADGSLPYAVVVTAYGDNNQIIETYTVGVDTASDSYNAGLFVGISRSAGDIRSLSFKGVGTVVDDFAFTAPIPEPGTWALMLGGLAALGASARRRRIARCSDR